MTLTCKPNRNEHDEAEDTVGQHAGDHLLDDILVSSSKFCHCALFLVPVLEGEGKIYSFKKMKNLVEYFFRATPELS